MAGKEDQREEALNASTEDEDVQTFISSRLCIKNLPKHITEARFREHFSSIGEVTDCVIKNTHHGGTDENDKNRSSWQHRKQRRQTSRCLGFIGYKTEQMAILAQKYFHNTFIDTSRIDVSFAASRKERAALSERSSWSKYSAGTSANERLKREEEKKLKKKKNKDDEDDGKEEEKKDPIRFIGVRERIKMEKAAKLKKEQFVSPEEKMLEEKMREDPKLREYMALMLPKSKFAAKFWSDGLVHEEDEYLSGGPPAQQTKLADIEDTEGGNADEDSDDDEYQDLENDDSSDDNSSSSEEIDSDSDDVKKDDAVSDMEYLKAKRGNFSSDSEDSEEEEEEGNSSDDDDDDDDENNSEKSSDDEGKEFSLENDDDVDNTQKKRSSKKSKSSKRRTWNLYKKPVACSFATFRIRARRRKYSTTCNLASES